MEIAHGSNIPDSAGRPVLDLLSAIEAAWNRSDLQAYSGLYARNASYVSRAGTLLNGRAEIEQLHAVAFAGNLRNTRLSLKVRQIQFLMPTVVLVHADIELSQIEDLVHKTRAITTFVVASVDEDWRICAAHTTEVHAASMA